MINLLYLQIPNPLCKDLMGSLIIHMLKGYFAPIIVLVQVVRKLFVFCWIPSHVGIPGNEKADQAAKDALTEVDFRKVPVPCTDIKQYINKHVFSLWQSSWDLAIHNKLHSSRLLVSGNQAKIGRAS